MYLDTLDDCQPGETLRDCLKTVYDTRKAALLPPRMADLLAQLERRERDGESR